MDSAKIDLEELESLAKVSYLPWHIRKVCQLDDHHDEIKDSRDWWVKNINDTRDQYIFTACNAVPKLITDNLALQKQVQELKKALIELVKIEISLPECAVCWERDQCTDRSHGNHCLTIGHIVDTAKEAAKETE